VALAVATSACGGGDDAEDASAPWVGDVEAAMAAVDDERGGAQQYFEVTATPQLTNVFVAVDDAAVAVPYLFVDGELQPPAPSLEGASGFTFTAADVDIDEAAVLSRVEAELPGAAIVALSVEGVGAADAGTEGGIEGGGVGGGDASTVRYVVSVQSERGGFLDVTVSGDGRILAVDPL